MHSLNLQQTTRSVSPHIDVAWPEEPGAYRLMVDLWVEGVGWFAERVGRPLAQATVEVTARPDPGSR